MSRLGAKHAKLTSSFMIVANQCSVVNAVMIFLSTSAIRRPFGTSLIEEGNGIRIDDVESSLAVNRTREAKL